MKSAIVLFFMAMVVLGFGVWGVYHATKSHDEIVILYRVMSEHDFSYVIHWCMGMIVIGIFIGGVAAWTFHKR